MKNIKDKETFLKSRFVEMTTRQTFDEVADAQERVVNEIEQEQNFDFNEEKIKAVKNSLRHFSVDVKGSGIKGTMRIHKYTRYLDMKTLRGERRKQFHLYNRLVFGALYVGYIPKLKFGFTESVKNQLAGEYNIEL